MDWRVVLAVACPFLNAAAFLAYADAFARRGGLSKERRARLFALSTAAPFAFVPALCLHLFAFVPLLLGAALALPWCFGRPRITALGPILALAVLLVPLATIGAGSPAFEASMYFGGFGVFHLFTAPALWLWLRARLRVRREARCPGCGYPMRSLGRHVARCPECGHLDPDRFACMSCGYSWIGLERTLQACPECGSETPWASVAESVGGARPTSKSP